jgi:hypothetical protein
MGSSNYSSNGWQSVTYTIPKATVQHRSPRRRRRSEKTAPRKLPEYSDEQIKNLPDLIREKGRHNKKWFRLDLGKVEEQRVWKTATFLTENVFVTRMHQKRGAIIYHICFETPKHVLYSKAPRMEDLPQDENYICTECDQELPSGAGMLILLQKLSR